MPGNRQAAEQTGRPDEGMRTESNNQSGGPISSQCFVLFRLHWFIQLLAPRMH